MIYFIIYDRLYFYYIIKFERKVYYMAKPRKSKDENRMIVIFDDDPAVEEWLLAQKNRKASLIQLIKVTQLKYGNTDVNKMSLNDLLGNIPFSQHSNMNNISDVISRNAKNKLRGKSEKVSDTEVKTDENLEKVSPVKETSSKAGNFSVDDDLDDVGSSNNGNKQLAENNNSNDVSDKKESKKIDTSDKMLQSIMNF